jgi:hypothetical protein
MELRALIQLVFASVGKAFDLLQLARALGLESGDILIEVGVLSDQVIDLHLLVGILCTEITVNFLCVIYLHLMSSDFSHESSILLLELVIRINQLINLLIFAGVLGSEVGIERGQLSNLVNLEL